MTKQAPSPINTPARILVINPGSTSTKLALFEDETEVISSCREHKTEKLRQIANVAGQLEMRLEIIHDFMSKNRIITTKLHAVIARGGLLKPLQGGVYTINQAMLEDLRHARFGEHASNLGALLAHSLTNDAECPAFIADPVVVDELDDVARISGLPELERKSIFHALNQKSVARATARGLNKTYEECNLIVAHMGGGISVGAHKRGRVVDVNNALDGDGPFAPERSGGLPAGQLAQMCFSGSYTLEAIRGKIVGGGGLTAFRGSNSFSDLKKAMTEGDARAKLLYEGLVYQVSQEIAKHSATLRGEIDAIVLTGGLANDQDFTQSIRERIGHLAPIRIIPGEREMQALAQCALAVLRELEKPREYN